MATTRYDTLVPLVLPEVHGCSDPLAEQAIRDAVIDLCQRSRIWVVICDPVDVTATQAAYDIDLPAQSALVRLLSVRAGQCDPLTPASADQLDESLSSDWTTETGTPKHYVQVDDDSFLLTPIPDATLPGQLKVRLAAKPSRSSTGFPAWINERYQEYILAGAKARLLAKQGQPWHNPNLATGYLNYFDTGVAAAEQDATESLVRSEIQTAPQH